MDSYMDPYADAAEAAKAAWFDLVTMDPPLPMEERLSLFLSAHLTALKAAGCIKEPGRHSTPHQAHEITQDDLEAAAQWLAGHSGARRYTDGQWTLLLTHPHHIEAAYARARTNLAFADENTKATLVGVRQMLLETAAQKAEGR